jgi:hypothetical protein
MMSEYIIPGTLSKQLNENIENNPNINAYPELIYIIVAEERSKYRVHKTPSYKY